MSDYFLFFFAVVPSSLVLKKEESASANTSLAILLSLYPPISLTPFFEARSESQPPVSGSVIS